MKNKGSEVDRREVGGVESRGMQGGTFRRSIVCKSINV